MLLPFFCHSFKRDRLLPMATVSNKKFYSCFWLDEQISQTKDYQNLQKELRKIINNLQLFDNIDECERCIRKVKQEKLILIVSNSLAQQILPRIHDFSQLTACYIYSHDRTDDRQWIKNFSKVKGIFHTSSQLLIRVSQDRQGRLRSTDDRGTVSLVTGNRQLLESRNAIFLWFQLFIEVLLRMHHTSHTRQELIDLCQESYKTDSSELSIIDEFRRTYKTENAIWWYTRECFLYRMLNKALRIQDFQTLFTFRFFMSDLAKQLTIEYERYLRELSTRDRIRVYRGQAIGVDELKLMQLHIGEFISMNSFLSTSVHRQTAIGFLYSIQITDDIERILFEIDIDPREKTVPFSRIDRLSYFETEEEILIMLGALFRIESIEQDRTKRFWIVSVTLASQDDFYLKETFAHMKQTIGDETNFDSLGKILTEMGQYEQAEKCYRRMICEAQLNRSIAYAGLAWADHWSNNYDTALENLQKSLVLIEEIRSDICEEKGKLFSAMGLVYWRKKQYEDALENLNRALRIQQMILPAEHADLLATYNRLAITYSAMNQIEQALEFYNKCLTIRLATLPHDHPDIATSYNNLGWLYDERIGDYTKALEYFQKALVICRKTLPSTHRDIIRTEQNIRKVNEKLKNK